MMNAFTATSHVVGHGWDKSFSKIGDMIPNPPRHAKNPQERFAYPGAWPKNPCAAAIIMYHKTVHPTA
jgi:hypothetical protein